MAVISTVKELIVVVAKEFRDMFVWLFSGEIP